MIFELQCLCDFFLISIFMEIYIYIYNIRCGTEDLHS